MVRAAKGILDSLGMTQFKYCARGVITAAASAPRTGLAMARTPENSPPINTRPTAHRVSRLAKREMMETDPKYRATKGVVNTIAPKVADSVLPTKKTTLSNSHMGVKRFRFFSL